MILPPEELREIIDCDLNHDELLELSRAFQQLIIDESANVFTIPQRYIASNDYSFDGTEKSLTFPAITDTVNNFDGFETIYIETDRHLVNYGHYDIKSVSQNPFKILFQDYEEIVTESRLTDDVIYVMPVDFPSPIKQAIKILAKSMEIPVGIKSEKIGGYSISYADFLSSSPIPAEVERFISPYRKLTFV